MAGLRKALSGCAIAVGVLVVAFVGMMFWYFQGLTPGRQPDVEKAARSATAQAADQAVTAQVDGQIDRIRAALPWATYLGTSVADVCSTKLTNTPFVGMKQSWVPVTCTRTDTLYESFDGDFRQRLAQIDSALASVKWRPYGPQDRGLAATYDYDHVPPPDASPSQIATAAAWPNQLSLSYGPPVTQNFPPPADSTVYVRARAEVEVAQAPHRVDLDGGQFEHDRPQESSDGSSYYRAWQPYTLAQVAAARPAHSIVLAVELSMSYGTSPAEH